VSSNFLFFFPDLGKMNVLYVASDKNDRKVMCPGSTVCISIAKDIPEHVLSIQDCDILKQSKQEIPDWLDGTPLLINEEEGIPYRGREAISKMHEISSFVKAKSKKRRESQKQAHAQLPPPPPPQQQQNNENRDFQLPNDATNSAQQSSLDDHFKMDVQQLDETRSDKVTEQDLQKYMELRNASPASAPPPSNQQ